MPQVKIAVGFYQVSEKVFGVLLVVVAEGQIHHGHLVFGFLHIDAPNEVGDQPGRIVVGKLESVAGGRGDFLDPENQPRQGHDGPTN